MALHDKVKNKNASEETQQQADMLELDEKLNNREDALNRVGTALKGLSDGFIAVAVKIDEEQKYYTPIVKETQTGKQEYVVVEDTLLEAIEKETKALEKLNEVKAIPACDERYLSGLIEKTGKTAEDIVGAYLDKLSEYLLNEQERNTLNRKNVKEVK